MGVDILSGAVFLRQRIASYLAQQMNNPIFFQCLRPPRGMGGRQIRGWVYRNLFFEIPDNGVPIDPKTGAMIIKHWVLKQERKLDKLRREVQAFDNMEALQRTPRREPIPESIRLFVWQRDKGQCVKCASRAKLEFDHIIPVVSGGSSTERDVQLLCEPCNRSKGATI
jgi:hypothetical protein